MHIQLQRNFFLDTSPALVKYPPVLLNEITIYDHGDDDDDDMRWY